MAEKDTKKELFFPYYVNQGRLLDIYAILNNGYSEYTEISTAINAEKTKAGKAEVKAEYTGFKLFNIGGGISGSLSKTNSQQDGKQERRVQTVTSILSMVKSQLQENGHLVEIQEAKPGDFVCIPVVLTINSIKSLLSEIKTLMKLSESMSKQGEKKNTSNNTTKDLDDLLKTIQIVFSGEEIIYETDEYAVIGNIVDDNLYQSTRSDIIGSNLKCLAQVKRVFPEGTELMKNTIFSKIKDAAAKAKFISAIADASKQAFEFEATAVASINGKPVYQLEIIALYQ